VADNTEWIEKLRTVAQDHVDEPVIAAGLFAPAGAMGGMGVGKLSGLGGMFRDRKINERAGGLGHHGAFKLRQALIAVTAGKVYGFNSKPKGRSGWQIVDRAVEWDRTDVTVTVEDRKITRMVTFTVGPDGATYELEMNKLAGDLNDALLAELGTSPPG
jgi:hypothetical protein